MTRLPGLLLAGGLSRRMGEDKALLPFGQKRLIDHAIGRLARQCEPVWVNRAAPVADLSNHLTIPDDIPGHAGPLAGVAAGLGHLRKSGLSATRLLTVAVDTPFFPQDLGIRLLAVDPDPNEIVVATDAEGRWHPIFALWPASIEDDLGHWLEDPGNRKVRSFIDRHPHRTVAFPLIAGGNGFIEPFFNINTPEDYQRALSLLDHGA